MSSAFSLLLVGMITVFVVLLLVVVTGNLLIRLVNRIGGSDTDGGISPSKVAAIASAVEVVTQGKGRVERIEKQ